MAAIASTVLSHHPGPEVLHVLKLNHLQDNPGAIKKKRRKGRGVGSSKGKTAGRGHKGQKAKESIHPLFEGGQTPLYKLVPKRGFNNKRHQQLMTPLNLHTLQMYIDMGRVDASKLITAHDIVQAGIFKINSVKHGIKLLLGKLPNEELARGGGGGGGAGAGAGVGAGGGQILKQPINIQVSRASTTAIAAVEDAGGRIVTVHYNRLALRQLLKPQLFVEAPIRRARPPPKWQPYYTSYKNRGYLNPRVQMQNWLTAHPLHQSTFEQSTKSLL